MLFYFVLPALVLMALLAYTRPQTAIILLVGLVPVYLIRFSVAGIPTNIFEICLLIVFSCSVVQKEVRQQWQEAFKSLPRRVVFLVAIFVLFSIVSTFISPHLQTSLGILKSWIFIPLIFGWMVYAFKYTDKKENFHAGVLFSLVVSGLVVSCIGLTQLGRLDRVRSLYDVSNSLALYVVPLLVIAFYLTINGFRKILYLPATIIMAGALVATKSASGIAAAIMAMIIGIIIHYSLGRSYQRRQALAGGVIVFLFIVVSFFVMTVSGRLSYLVQPRGINGTHNSISVRVQMWDISWELLREHPLLGVGLGAFEPAYQKKLHDRFSYFNNCKALGENCSEPIAEFVYRDPHNWFLSFWLNTGFIGVVSFVLLNVVIMWRVVSRQSSVLSKNNGVFVIAAALALLSIFLFGLTDTIYWKNDLALLYWILLALLM